MQIIALIPSYGKREYLKDMQGWLAKSGEVDDVIVLKQDIPFGASNVRRQLITQAFEKYGENAAYLMLDDDCVFTDNSKIRDAARHFDELENIGVISIPTYIPSPKGESHSGVYDKYYEIVRAYHCFLINGKVLASPSPLGEGRDGVNYTPDEYCDELDFSIKTWLAGFRNIITYRCIIWHHAVDHSAIEPSGNDVENSSNIRAIQEGKLKMKSSFISNYSKYFKFNTFKLFDVEIPQFFSIVPNKEGVLTHNENRRLLRIKQNIPG